MAVRCLQVEEGMHGHDGGEDGSGMMFVLSSGEDQVGDGLLEEGVWYASGLPKRGRRYG